MNYSKIIAGTMTWGSWGKGFSTSEMSDLIKHCFSEGIHTFDHADIYGGYSTEGDFGKAFAESGINRTDVEFISKCGLQINSDNRRNEIKHYQYDADYIVWSAEQSLKHLKTDYLDLLLLHRPSPLMAVDEIASASGSLKKQGKIRNFGVSNFSPSQMDLIETSTKIEANQIEFSLTHSDAMYDGTLDHMTINTIVPMAWSPLGTYFKEENEQTKRISTVLRNLSDTYNVTQDQLLLAWILKHPAKIHPVIGTTNKQRITNSVNAQNIDLELKDWFKLLEAAKGHEVP